MGNSYPVCVVGQKSGDAGGSLPGGWAECVHAIGSGNFGIQVRVSINGGTPNGWFRR